MSRGKGTSHCAFRRLVADQGIWATHERYRMGETWCGESRLYSESDRAESPKLADCPKCAAALGKVKLAAIGRVALRKLDTPFPYHRSTYALDIDGVERGYVATESGWGKGWSLQRLSRDKPDSSYRYHASVSGNRPNRYDCRTGTRDFMPVHYAARDAMAVAAFAAFERGELPTEAESVAAEERDKARRAEREAERVAESARRALERDTAEALRAERYESARMALEALRARELSNVELAGIDAIRALLGV